MFKVVLDTCVLWPSLQRDFLLSLAVEEMYLPKWNIGILEELRYCEINKHLKDGYELEHATNRANNLLKQMHMHFPRSLVTGWEVYEHDAGSPDQNDNHVIATAIACEASAIITDDKNGFPQELGEQGIEIMRVQDFIHATVEINPWLALQALEKIQDRRLGQKPALPITRIMEILEQRYSMTEAVKVLRMAYSTLD